MSDGTIAAALVDHFGRSFTMLREAVEACPDEAWRTADIDWLAPARQALHVVAAVDLYMRREYTPGIAAGHRFGENVDWEDGPVERMPSRAELLTYLDEVHTDLKTWLGGLSDEDLLRPTNVFNWTGNGILGRMLYLLRHNQHHQGILHAELRRRGIGRPRWR